MTLLYYSYFYFYLFFPSREFFLFLFCFSFSLFHTTPHIKDTYKAVMAPIIFHFKFTIKTPNINYLDLLLYIFNYVYLIFFSLFLFFLHFITSRLCRFPYSNSCFSVYFDSLLQVFLYIFLYFYYFLSLIQYINNCYLLFIILHFDLVLIILISSLNIELNIKI